MFLDIDNAFPPLVRLNLAFWVPDSGQQIPIARISDPDQTSHPIERPVLYHHVLHELLEILGNFRGFATR